MTTQHPVYIKAKAPNSHGWIAVADTARLVRDALARSFPGIKFYVRSESYAGGASIDVHYDGLTRRDPPTSCSCPTGPTFTPSRPYVPGDPCTTCGYIGRSIPVRPAGAPDPADVEAVAGGYAGGRFDGMIDMAYGVRSWLNPDGSTSLGHSPGTGGQRGSDPGYDHPAPQPDAISVRFGANYVFVRDELPYDVRAKAGAA